MDEKTLGNLANALCTCGYMLPYSEHEGHTNRLESTDHEADCSYRPVAELAEQHSALLEACESVMSWIETPGNEEEGGLSWFADVVVPKVDEAIARVKGEKTN